MPNSCFKSVKFSFEIGDLVRLSRANTPFKKSYQENFTEEIFKIHTRIPSHPPRYKVKDLTDEIVKGSYNEPELQKVHIIGSLEDIEYKIDKIVATKTIGGKKYSLIKWYGYSDKFNSYIPTTKVKNYKGKV